MDYALEEAKKAFDRGEVPVGAVLINNLTNQIISSSGNQTEELNDPTAHAEILVIKEACLKLNQTRLENCDLYVTLEPCSMCATAISFARIKKLFFGAYDPKSGGVDHGAKIFSHKTCHHVPEVYGGIKEQQCKKLITIFFKKLRSNNHGQME
ncbi:MAG: nucleoside deaminase [Alphaproteobacteria bacterium]|nr:nucleoside deaminase [Alphaproteobacteria bacterium]